MFSLLSFLILKLKNVINLNDFFNDLCTQLPLSTDFNMKNYNTFCIIVMNQKLKISIKNAWSYRHGHKKHVLLFYVCKYFIHQTKIYNININILRVKIFAYSYKLKM